MQNETGQDLTRRLILAALGAVAGLALWFLTDKLPDLTDNSHLVLTLSALIASSFAILLITIGPLPLQKALLATAIIALPATALFATASLRFTEASGFLDTGHGLVAYLALLFIALPFTLAALRPGDGWRHYPALFTHAWEIVVRYGVALLFTCIFWLLIWLSDAVLKIVGITLISDLLDFAPMPFLLTGTMIGLGLSVVWELHRYISPDLFLRLLRLLLPMVLVVSAIFVAAAPLRGLSNLFGSFSAAATLMAMAIAAATLITITIDRDAPHAATAKLLSQSAWALSLILPVLGGLALWAVMQRASQYGWTPMRLAAGVSAGITLAYGIAYALALLSGRRWQARIRSANTALALGLAGLAVLWLSPVLNAERISAKSQLARYESGSATGDQIDLWALSKEWGKPGAAVLELLREKAPNDSALSENFAILADASGRWTYDNRQRRTSFSDDVAALREKLILRPEGKHLPDGLFDPYTEISTHLVENTLTGCEFTTPQGVPGCLALIADFLPNHPGDEVLLVLNNMSNRYLPLLLQDGGSATMEYNIPIRPGAGGILIDQILAGDYQITPAPFNVLVTDGAAIGILP
ncbi:MAG: DUF4153 domain-containing protein [Maritimibacter sp.]